jgi:hypothetical protein
LTATDPENGLAILRGEIQRLRELGIGTTLPPDDALRAVVGTLEARLNEPPRPLFLLFAARALAEGGDPDDWSAESLVRVILDHELRHWSSVAERDGINGPHVNAFSLATLTGGLAVEELEALPFRIPLSTRSARWRAATMRK